MTISVVIPVYNEEEVIGKCLDSLGRQTVTKNLETIVVDDASTDETPQKVAAYPVTFLKQSHQGPGAARNLGAKVSKGEILVFVDADMEFDPDFVEKLVAPIVAKKTIGTFSQEEYLLNKKNIWARCWNLNLGRSAEKMEPQDFDKNKNSIYIFLKNILQKLEGNKVTFKKNESHVFRAILKSEFEKAGGFDPKAGYTDDWTLSERLGVLADAALGARYYHRNPATLEEVWKQARWFGKNKFLTKNFVRRIYNLVRYCPPLAVIKGLSGAIKFQIPEFFFFKIDYDTAVFISVVLSFFNEQKSK